MDEFIHVDNREPAPQKPPLSLARIAGEILAGSAVGFPVAMPVVYVTGTPSDDGACFGAFSFLAMFLNVFRPLYGLAGAVGVYLVGTKGNETGSFLPTLGWGIVGGLVMLVMPVPSPLLSGGDKIVLWAFVLLIAPTVATLGFNLTRRYKEAPSSQMEHGYYRSCINAFICSLMPMGIAVGLIGLVDLASPDILRPGRWGDFGGLLYGPVRLCVGILIALMTIPPAVYGVLLGVAAIREPEARGKPLAGTAIVLGMLEIVIGTGYLSYLFRIFSKVD